MWVSKVTAHTFSVSTAPVFTTPMDNKWMKKYNISSFHGRKNFRSIRWWHALNTKVSFVYASFPIGVNVLKELALVGSWVNDQWSIFSSGRFKSTPSSYNSICRSERKVCKILMKRMSASWAHVRRLIDEHSVYRFDIWSTKALQIWNYIRVSTECVEDRIILKVLYFCDGSLSLCLHLSLSHTNISHNLHSF